MDVVRNAGLLSARLNEALDGARGDRADHLSGAVEADEEFIFSVARAGRRSTASASSPRRKIARHRLARGVRDEYHAELVALAAHGELAAFEVDAARKRAELGQAQTGGEEHF